ncbi:MAG: hypothetical protein ACRD1Y_05960 [Terriglobales bacterium]
MTTAAASTASSPASAATIQGALHENDARVSHAPVSTSTTPAAPVPPLPRATSRLDARSTPKWMATVEATIATTASK